jgi:hypothetical protein
MVVAKCAMYTKDAFPGNRTGCAPPGLRFIQRGVAEFMVSDADCAPFPTWCVIGAFSAMAEFMVSFATAPDALLQA